MDFHFHILKVDANEGQTAELAENKTEKVMSLLGPRHLPPHPSLKLN